MSQAVYLWVKAFHLVGVFLWGGSMVALAATLGAFGRATAADTRASMLALANRFARSMELGLLIAIPVAASMKVIVQEFYHHYQVQVR